MPLVTLRLFYSPNWCGDLSHFRDIVAVTRQSRSTHSRGLERSRMNYITCIKRGSIVHCGRLLPVGNSVQLAANTLPREIPSFTTHSVEELMLERSVWTAFLALAHGHSLLQPLHRVLTGSPTFRPILSRCVRFTIKRVPIMTLSDTSQSTA